MAQARNLIIVAPAAAGLGVLGTYAFFAYRQPPGPVAAGQAAGAAGPPGGGAPKDARSGGGAPGAFAVAVEAIEVNNAVLRLRPFLMTTGAMVLGAVPLALPTGAGAESRQQIGWVIVGGLLLGTLLTLFVVASVYSLFARRRAPTEPAEAIAAPAA